MKWSLSSWGTYEGCAFRYKLKYIDGLKEARSENTAASRGVDIHKDIENFLTTEFFTLPENLRLYEDFLKNLRRMGAFTELKIGVDQNWSPVDWEHLDVWCRAVLDCLALLTPNAKVYDWKSGKEYDDHYEQKELYSILAFAAYPEIEEVEAIHVYVDLGKNTTRTYTRSQAEGLRQRWVDRVAKIENEKAFIPKPSWKCRSCGFSKAKGGPCRF